MNFENFDNSHNSFLWPEYVTNFYVKEGSDVRLGHPSCVYMTAQRQYTTVYKRCVHLWNNFSCIIIPCVISNIVFITFKISDWHAGLYNIFYLLLLQYTVCFHKQYTNNFRLESHIFKKSWWFSYWCHCNHYCNQFCHQVYFLSFHFKVKYKDFRT